MLVPDSWKEYREFLGTPVVLVGPYENSVRPVIQVTPLLAKAEKDGTENKAELETKYKTIKTDYVKRLHGEIVGFDDYEKTSWSGVKDVYSMGVTFKTDGVKVSEKSYYVLCPNDALIHIHTSVQESQMKKYSKEVESIVKSFQCGGKL